jgi:hypothetical protein
LLVDIRLRGVVAFRVLGVRRPVGFWPIGVVPWIMRLPGLNQDQP